MSWMALGRKQFDVVEAFHIHHLAEESLDFLRSLIEERGPAQTIARRMILRERVRSAERIRDVLDRPDLCLDPWLILTGIRDPVARLVSLLCYCGDFFGCIDRPLSFRDGVTVDDLSRYLRESLDRLLSNQPASDTFRRMVDFYLRDFERWFESEFRSVLKIELAFPPGPPERVVMDGARRVMVYRVEDMAAGSPGHEILCRSVETFCGAAVTAFPVNNATQGRRTETLYRAFLEQLRIPMDVLDRIYSGATVRRFYTPAEIETFKQRWSRR